MKSLQLEFWFYALFFFYQIGELSSKNRASGNRKSVFLDGHRKPEGLTQFLYERYNIIIQSLE